VLSSLNNGGIEHKEAKNKVTCMTLVHYKMKYALMLRTTQKVKDINRRRRLGYLFTEA